MSRPLLYLPFLADARCGGRLFMQLEVHDSVPNLRLTPEANAVAEKICLETGESTTALINMLLAEAALCH